jgi:hypothetical protein
MMNKGGFSWKKASGISKAKSNLSRKTGIPMTKSGRQQKIGRTVSKGCLVTLLGLISIPFFFIYIISFFF